MKFCAWSILAIVVTASGSPRLAAQETQPVAVESPAANGDTPADVLSPDEWQRVDASVERALEWLASQQQPDGSFPTIQLGQPGVTSLCMMAFMAHGHLPGEGPYGQRLERATDYVLRCQKPCGLVSLLGPEQAELSRFMPHEVAETACYNHAISALLLSELYGMNASSRAEPMRASIAKALVVTLEMQQWPKDRSDDRGGWRYLDDEDVFDSDLSVTGWELMFLRSARNAGFDVPAEPIDEAVSYVRRCFAPEVGVFCYATNRPDSRSRGMAGAGILALAHAGFHQSAEAQEAGEWVLANNFDDYNPANRYSDSWRNDRYHYCLFNCCQGMYQLGGRYWQEFFPRAVETLLANQERSGSWSAERVHDGQFGKAYTTALVVLSLGAPNQLLPIFQR